MLTKCSWPPYISLQTARYIKGGTDSQARKCASVIVRVLFEEHTIRYTDGGTTEECFNHRAHRVCHTIGMDSTYTDQLEIRKSDLRSKELLLGSLARRCQEGQWAVCSLLYLQGTVGKIHLEWSMEPRRGVTLSLPKGDGLRHARSAKRHA